MQVELGFGNRIVNEFFYVAGYDVRGFVVAQVNSPLGTTLTIIPPLFFYEHSTLFYYFIFIWLILL